MSYVLALITVVLAPNQHLGTITRAGLRMTPADIMLGVTLVAFAVESWRARSRIVWPPGALWALVIVAALSPLASPAATLLRADWARTTLRETAQLIEWFLVAYLVFRNVFFSPSRARIAIGALVAVTAALAVFAFVQWCVSGDPREVSASFGTLGWREFHPSRHAYGAYMALALPLMLGLLGAVGRPRRGGRGAGLALSLGLVVIGALTVATISSGGALVAVIIGLVAVIGVSARRWPTVAAAAAAIVIGSVPWRMIHGGDVGIRELGNFSRDGGVKIVYSEWQAGLSVLERHFPSGVGIGNYDSNIRLYYQGPQLEWDSHNGYLVLGSTAGWLALVMLMAALVYFGGLAVRASRLSADPRWSALAAGLAGALAGFVVAQVYSSLLVRGTGLVIGLIFALIAVLASEEQGSHAAETASSDS